MLKTKIGISVLLLSLFISCSKTPESIPEEITKADFAQRVLLIDSIHEKVSKNFVDSIYQKVKSNTDDISLQFRLSQILYSRNIFYLNNNIEDELLKCLSLSQKNNNEYLIATALHYLGIHNWVGKSDKGKGFLYYKQAYSLYNKFDAAEFPDKFRFIYDYASSFYSFEEYDKAIELFEEAISLGKYRATGMYISAHNTIALAHKWKFEYAKALEYYFKALSIAQKYNDKPWQSIIEGNIGTIYF